MNERPMIVGVGEVLWDAFPEGEAFGGAPANFVSHCHSQGARTGIISCLGTDERGEKAHRFLTDHGVDTSGLAQTGDYPTGVVQVTLDEKGKPEYDICEGVAWDHIPFTPEIEAHWRARSGDTYRTAQYAHPDP